MKGLKVIKKTEKQCMMKKQCFCVFSTIEGTAARNGFLASSKPSRTEIQIFHAEPLLTDIYNF
jgi:hypothetical protein